MEKECCTDGLCWNRTKDHQLFCDGKCHNKNCPHTNPPSAIEEIVGNYKEHFAPDLFDDEEQENAMAAFVNESERTINWLRTTLSHFQQEVEQKLLEKIEAVIESKKAKHPSHPQPCICPTCNEIKGRNEVIEEIRAQLKATPKQ